MPGGAFGADKGRLVACGSSRNHPPKPSCESSDDREAAVWAGMFHALGNQGWGRVQDLERQGLPGVCTGLKLGASGLLVGLEEVDHPFPPQGSRTENPLQHPGGLPTGL